MGNTNEVDNDIVQAEAFLKGVLFFKGKEWTMLFWEEKLAHRFPFHKWNGKRLVRNDISQTQTNITKDK